MEEKNAGNATRARLNRLANHLLNVLLVGAIAYAMSGFVGKKLGDGWSDILQGIAVLSTLIALGVVSVRTLRNPGMPPSGRNRDNE